MTFPSPDLTEPHAGRPVKPVVVWLVISVVWLAATWLAWALVGELTYAEDEGGSLADSARPLVLAESAVTMVTTIGVAGLLPAVRRGSRTSRITLGRLMAGLAAGHLVTLGIATWELLIGSFLGFFMGPGGGTALGLYVVLASIVVVVSDAVLVVLAFVCAAKLRGAAPPQVSYPAGSHPPSAGPGSHPGVEPTRSET